MDDLSFLSQAAAADASATSTLMVLLPDGSVTQIHNINRFTLLDKCPFLFHAFEFREFGDVEQASIEIFLSDSSPYKATSRSAIVSLLRFLYTGTYLLDPDGCLGSLLPHVEAFKLAEDFDVPEFQVQAYVNFTRETEFSCCNATPPSDLCDTIKFIYQHFAGQESQEHQSLLDTILNYCVSVFTYQVLGDRQDFRQTAFENPTFHRGLCRISMSRNFEDEGANDIVQLPVCRPTPHSQSALLKRAIGDFQYEIWQEGEEPTLEANEIENSSPTKKRKPSHGGFMLVHRPKTTGGGATLSESESESESSADEYGFSLVHRPKLEGKSNPASTASPTLSDTCTDLFVDAPLPTVTEPEPGQESNQHPKQETAGLTSDDEWDLV
ncbi:uncharacterized protein N0V89_008535 [Didymosphaeria variabile]|uniref:BTB domain-containing protein n=1 Tax=Didymosphaeria variabile TaxID=1932322 RepID=A0A9W8XGG7_9PLEO|nr:uncharacterized protein N0V89_008535 [Didymosphaeria variabile]KAJ4349915.1 hypothetical protein N0V89_008535 [Didymosphaeria variabile]